jgi:hypothetical protein
MATINISLIIENQQIIDDAVRVLDGYDGENLQEKIKSFLKKEIMQKINNQRNTDAMQSVTNISDTDIT